MPGEAGNVGEAGLAAVFERLREEVRASTTSPADRANRSSWLVARQQAELKWPVSAERPFASRTGLVGRARGAALIPLKSTLRRLMRWYVEPLAVDQRMFNAAVLRLIDQLSDRIDADGARRDHSIEELERVARRLPEVDDRLFRLERARRGSPRADRDQPHGQEPPAVIGDYFGFEVRMRGPSDDVRSRQERYVDDFRDAAPVLDAGCGRGEFLELLRDAGIEAHGVDSDDDMVAFCRSRGLDVVKADAIAHLRGLPDASLGGVFAAQLVEHLAPQALLRLLDLSSSKLRHDGVLVIETINPLSFVALRHYFADLTHSHPLVPGTLELMARQSGFGHIELRFLNEPPESERLRNVDLPHEPEFEDARRALAANVERLNDVIFGPQDYALVARR